jgi:hypothetical protein
MPDGTRRTHPVHEEQRAVPGSVLLDVQAHGAACSSAGK